MSDTTQERTSGDVGSPPGTLTPEAEMAFRHAIAFGRKVAHELVAARVPEDDYVVQEARLRPPREAFGFHALGDVVTSDTAERRVPIDGWRVHAEPLEEVTRIGRHGGPREQHPYTRRTHEMWLLRDGSLRSVRLDTDSFGAVTAAQTSLTAAEALRLDVPTTWQETTRKEHGSTWVEGRREPSGEEPAAPCSRLSEHLSVLRRRAH